MRWKETNIYKHREIFLHFLSPRIATVLIQNATYSHITFIQSKHNCAFWIFKDICLCTVSWCSDIWYPLYFSSFVSTNIFVFWVTISKSHLTAEYNPSWCIGQHIKADSWFCLDAWLHVWGGACQGMASQYVLEEPGIDPAIFQLVEDPLYLSLESHNLKAF